MLFKEKNMDIFKKRIEMLKKNQEVFEKNKNNVELGIILEHQKLNDYLKTGNEILSREIKKKFLEVRSIHYSNVLSKKMQEYTLPEWIVCLNEGVLLEYAIPVFSRVLYDYPMLCGMNNEWQVLYDITKINQLFWSTYRTWEDYFKNFVRNIVLKYEQGDYEFPCSEQYVIQFKKFSNM